MKRGFTLIELLVVIAIIGLLSSIVLASLNSARYKAMDARRKADLDEVYKALYLYYDANGYIPTTSSYGQADSGGWDYSSEGGGFMTFLSPYISNVKDPVNNGTGDVGNTGTGYAYAYYCYSDNTLTLRAVLQDGSSYYKANRETGWTCR